MAQRVIVFLSGGIDSPVAAHLMSEVGAKVTLLYFDNRPFTDEKTIQTVKELSKRLDKIHEGVETYSAIFGEIQKEIGRNCNDHLRCILCRRMMFRVGERLAEKVDADALVTGESLGQVASQTLSNMATTDTAVDIPILRPLVGLDKTEIIEIAREIGTYDKSNQPTICCMLTPEKPRVRSEVEELLREEQEIDVSKLISSSAFEKISL